MKIIKGSYFQTQLISILRYIAKDKKSVAINFAKDLKEQGLILFEAISGSRAYGTSLPTSDTDIRGVFIIC